MLRLLCGAMVDQERSSHEQIVVTVIIARVTTKGDKSLQFWPLYCHDQEWHSSPCTAMYVAPYSDMVQGL